MLTALILATVFQTAAATVAPAPVPPMPPAEPARQIAPDVFLLPGAFPPDREPDGNTVVLGGPDGLIVFDTGRHVQHSDAILAFAAAQHRPIAAIVNSHWHLDHSSGNGRLKTAFPHARVYATNAIDRALAPGGFLVRDAANIPTYLADPSLSPAQKDEVRIFADTMAHSEVLRPDVVVSRSARMRLAGRALDVHVTNHAVTDADIWLYDRSTHVAVLGDLVTLPVPFFETACPREWSQALDQVWATPFTTAIPGHGPPLTRVQFNAYRTGFNAFMDCVRSSTAAAQCGVVWADAIASLTPNPSRHDAIAQNAVYYVGFLRPHANKSPDCLLPS